MSFQSKSTSAPLNASCKLPRLTSSVGMASLFWLAMGGEGLLGRQGDARQCLPAEAIAGVHRRVRDIDATLWRPNQHVNRNVPPRVQHERWSHRGVRMVGGYRAVSLI